VVPPVTTLTLSSETKATLFRIMLWRCWASSEHGIARLGTYSLQSADMRLVPFHCVLTEVCSGLDRCSVDGQGRLDPPAF
jgi:hypothetical protein